VWPLPSVRWATCGAAGAVATHGLAGGLRQRGWRRHRVGRGAAAAAGGSLAAQLLLVGGPPAAAHAAQNGSDAVTPQIGHAQKQHRQRAPQWGRSDAPPRPWWPRTGAPPHPRGAGGRHLRTGEAAGPGQQLQGLNKTGGGPADSPGWGSTNWRRTRKQPRVGLNKLAVDQETAPGGQTLDWVGIVKAWHGRRRGQPSDQAGLPRTCQVAADQHGQVGVCRRLGHPELGEAVAQLGGQLALACVMGGGEGREAASSAQRHEGQVSSSAQQGLQCCSDAVATWRLQATIRGAWQQAAAG